MKKNSILIILCLFVLSSCVTNEYWKLRVEIPRKTPFSLQAFDEIIVTPFLVKEENADFDLNKELVEYFVGELKRKTENAVLTQDIGLDAEEKFTSSTFWKNLQEESTGKLYMTGSAEYTQETRKALLKKAKKRYEDPFPSQSRLEERKFFSLNLNLYLIDAQTGEPLYTREFKETKAYDNPNQTAYFAFFDLVQQVKEKLLRTVLGAEQIQERYLITR
jgi:hypothetical protein